MVGSTGGVLVILFIIAATLALGLLVIEVWLVVKKRYFLAVALPSALALLFYSLYM